MPDKYQYEHRKIADLIPYSNNTRTHSDGQVKQVADSIKEFGFTNPVLIDENLGIIAGHGRIMAAKKLKMDEVPTIMLTGLSEAQKKAYVMADNQLALNAGWDLEKLKFEIEDLKSMDFDVDVIGFSDKFMDNLFKTDDIFDTDVKDEKEMLLVIEFEEESDQESLYNELKERGYNIKVMD